MKNLERDTEIMDLWAERVTRKEIGKKFSLSVERIRQIVKRMNGVDSGWAVKRQKALENQRKDKALEALAKALSKDKCCVICRSWIVRSTEATCSEECAKKRSIVDYVDNETAKKRSLNQARTILRHPEKYNGHRIRWASKVIAQGGIAPNRRYVNPESRRGKILIETGNWPLPERPAQG